MSCRESYHFQYRALPYLLPLPRSNLDRESIARSPVPSDLVAPGFQSATRKSFLSRLINRNRKSVAKVVFQSSTQLNPTNLRQPRLDHAFNSNSSRPTNPPTPSHNNIRFPSLPFPRPNASSPSHPLLQPAAKIPKHPDSEVATLYSQRAVVCFPDSE